MNRSFLVPIVQCVLIGLNWISLQSLGRRFVCWICSRNQRSQTIQATEPYEPRLWNESYHLLFLVVSIFNLFVFYEFFVDRFGGNCIWTWGIAVGLPVYRIVEVLKTNGLIIFIDRELHFRKDDESQLIGSFYVLVGNLNSWMLMTFIMWIDLLICFSMLNYFWGADWCASIETPLSALYHTVVTMTTLGFGDVTPIADSARLLVLSQSLVFILFVLFILPVVISSIQTREIPKDDHTVNPK